MILTMLVRVYLWYYFYLIQSLFVCYFIKDKILQANMRYVCVYVLICDEIILCLTLGLSLILCFSNQLNNYIDPHKRAQSQIIIENRLPKSN